MDFHDVIRKISEIYCVDAVDMRILTAIANNSLFAIRNYDCNLQPTKDICRHHFAHVIDRQNLFLWMAIRSHYFPGLANRNSVGTTTVVHFPRVTIVFRVYVIRRVQHFLDTSKTSTTTSLHIFLQVELRLWVVC